MCVLSGSLSAVLLGVWGVFWADAALVPALNRVSAYSFPVGLWHSDPTRRVRPVFSGLRARRANCAPRAGLPLSNTHRRAISIGADMSMPVLPSQLFESFMAFAILALLLWRRKTAQFKGQIFYEFLILYSMGRFAVEFARGDDDRGTWLFSLFSTSQLIVLPIVLWALWQWRRGHVVQGGVR